MRALRLIALFLALTSCSQLKPLPQWSIELVSRHTDGEAFTTDSLGTSAQHNISANGKFVVYVSEIDRKIYMRNLDTGQSTWISDGPINAAHPEVSFSMGADLPCVNEDGTRVVFSAAMTSDTNRCSQNRRWDVYARDIANGVLTEPTLLTTRGSQPAVEDSGYDCQQHSNWPGLALSADARMMAVGSWDSELGPSTTNLEDSFVYMRELGSPLGEIRWLSENLNGTSANDRAYGPALSSDGSFAVFVARAQSLPGGDPNIACIYWRPTEPGGSARMRRLSSGRGADGTPMLSDGPSIAASISGDGQHVAYASLATNLVHGEPVGDGVHFQVFKVSSVADGPQDSVEPHFIAATGLTMADASPLVNPDTTRTRTSLSHDGRFLAFSSKCALADLTNYECDTTARFSQIYVYDSQADEFTQVTDAHGDSYAPSMSADATAISFVSEAPDLVEDLRDNNAGEPDIYVARWRN